ncbi:MAG: DUF1566 domain-containing protein [Bacteroidales bacterium]|nr:DUF1566 domain-containing protein [Bacteroidales bacterium]
MKKYLIVMVAAMAIVFTGCVKDLEKYGFAENTSLKGRVVEKSTHIPLSEINVSVTNGPRTYSSYTTTANGLFEMTVNFSEIESNYYLLLNGQGKSTKYELKGMGQKMFDYRDIELAEHTPYDELPTFEYAGHTYKVAPDPGNSMDWSNANSYCNNLSLYGVTGWKMPTRDELVQMYSERQSIGGFSSYQSYWSSTSNGSSYHYAVNFSSGSISVITDYSTVRVRPIHAEN